MRLRPRHAFFFALGLAVLGAAASACSDTQGTGTGPGGANEDAGADAPAAVTLRIDPPETTLTLDLSGTAPALPHRAYAKREGEDEVDVTSEVEWFVGNPALADVVGGNVSVKGLGGKSKVFATYDGVTAEASLTLTLRGDVFLPGTDASTKASFDAATADPDPSKAPALEYPEDGVVLPANLPPIEAQWTPGADSNVYRVRITSPDILDITLFTTGRELAFPADVWTKVAQSSPDVAVSLSVDGLGPNAMVRAGSPRSLTVASDGIDESAIYVWQSSTGSFRVLDIIKGTDVPLPTNSPALSSGQPCSGCHRISRDGKRFAYSFDGGNFNFGALAYDDAQKLYASTISPSPAVRGTYAAFNPLEDNTRPAMIYTSPDNVPQNTPGTVRLLLVDPDTNQPIANNLVEAIGELPTAVGHATLMPDWSPGGDFVVFTAYDNNSNYVRLLGDDTVLGSIVEMSVKYMADGSFQFGTPKVLVAAPPAAGTNPDTGENNVLPSISPDGTAISFTRADGWWSIKTQQSLINLSGRIAVVRRSDGTVLELGRGAPNGPEKVWSSTWSQWAPSVGKKWVWLAYASERPYGHKLTPQNTPACGLVQGQRQCKQLWITALDREKLAAGTQDPSQPAFWIPGQSITAQYVSPQWTVAVIDAPK
ncbi:hypothetical protein [Polyangium fumosum]|uniref:BIG2 domain-containing protein n=1 Tax=Polyangium fumosum TaxID=889272 RepID=A0A4V5PLJ5_9BACT|nr:hypothetical protein [Polyangium fumosum]TKC99581.1 hypothetical protein E8A74_37415 [Polyangium fumosum]